MLSVNPGKSTADSHHLSACLGNAWFIVHVSDCGYITLILTHTWVFTCYLPSNPLYIKPFQDPDHLSTNIPTEHTDVVILHHVPWV